jgi:serine/threonine protein kinase
MADIYLAVARGTLGFNKLVVLKHLRSTDDERSLDMFMDEARLAARLSHPNIVDTYDVGREGDSYFIAMEYLEGQSLSRLLKVAREKEIHPTAWARVVAEALNGLHYAHELRDYDGTPLQIVHRDVSPPNIFVTYAGEVKIVDFGIAKATLNVFQTDAGIFKGKLGYMAPEQAAGQRVDRRADLFSAGVVLWEALTGKRLLDGGIGLVVVKLIRADLPTVSSVNPRIDAHLSSIVERALKKDPRERYPTAAEMRDALEEYLRGCPDAMSKVGIGHMVMALFADHRASVQRQIEKHLASAESGVLERDFWTAGGALIARDAISSSVVPRSSSEATWQNAPGPASLPFDLTQPVTATDSVRSEPFGAQQLSPYRGGRWLIVACATAAVAALGILFLSQNVHEPSPSPALEPAAAVPPVPPAETTAVDTPAPPRPQPQESPPSTATTPSRRALVRARPSRSTRASPVAEVPRPPMVQAAAAPAAEALVGPSVNPTPPPAATPPPSPPVTVAPPSAREPAPPPGTVDAREVQVTVRAHAGEVQLCVDRARMEHPDLHGRLTVHATINPSGRVLSTSVTNPIEGGARLQACIVSAFQSWAFPPPIGGVNGNVSYSFVFE